ncbi:hypothetical protein HK096_004140 [Nowakowskiella sp. JEL0078]|nr:hypothetical protein HK096_004140 [Nowakowskiella sp. JEL0078]
MNNTSYNSPAIVQQRLQQQQLFQNSPQGNSFLSQQQMQQQQQQQQMQYQYQQYRMQQQQQQNQLLPLQQQQQQQPVITQQQGQNSFIQHRQQMSDVEFDQMLTQNNPHRITISSGLERKFSMDSDLSLSDTSINDVIASKDAFFEYVNKGPSADDDIFLDDEEIEDKRRREKKTESLVEFLKNTGPDQTPTGPKPKKNRGTGIFSGFGKKKNNKAAVPSSQQKKNAQQELLDRQRKQQELVYRQQQQNQQQQNESGGRSRYQPISVSYDSSSGSSKYGNGNQQALMAARNAANRAGGENSQSVQQLAEVLISTSGAEEPHPSKYLGHRPRRPESINMMNQQNGYGPQFVSQNNQQDPRMQQQYQQQQYSQPMQVTSPVMQNLQNMQNYPPQMLPQPPVQSSQPERKSSLDPRIADQLRAMTNENNRSSQVFAPNPPSNQPNFPGNTNNNNFNADDIYDDDEDRGYEDIDSDSDAMDEEVLKNTEYNAMIDVGLADVMESDAFVPLRQRIGPKRNIVFAQYVEEIPDSGDEEEDEDEYGEDDDGDESDDLRDIIQQKQDDYANQGNDQVEQVQQQRPLSQGSQGPPAPSYGNRVSSLGGSFRVSMLQDKLVAEPQKTTSTSVFTSTNTVPSTAEQEQQTQVLSAQAPVPAVAAATTQQTTLLVPQPQRTRKKVRHVQIQTRGPPLREIQIQTDPVTFSLPSVNTTVASTPPPISERERTLESENTKLSEQCSTLSSQLTDLQTDRQAMLQELDNLRENLRVMSSEKEQMAWKLEDDKNKFDKLSQQALKKIRELLNERQVMEVEIDGLRGQVDAFEEQYRDWDEEEEEQAGSAMAKRRSKALSKRYSELPSALFQSSGIAA